METTLNTFLTLCRTMNYRMAAEQLHLTQPAVTRQIQSLEQTYGCRLFCYDGRTLTKTPQAALLEEYAQSLRVNEEALRRELSKQSRKTLRVGATKTIGDHVIAPYVAAYLEDPENQIQVIIDNTRHLLEQLENNELDFAVIEGVFDKKRYDSLLLRNEPFSGICAREHPFAGQVIPLEALKGQTLLIRETGSGTRNFLEQDLMERGYDLSVFSRQVCVNSFPLLKELIRRNKGISFCYHAVIADSPDIATFEVAGFLKEHEFNAVYLKNTRSGKYAGDFLAAGK